MFDRIAVLGVGAIGSIIGGYIGHSGRDIDLIDMWPNNVNTINRDGLTVNTLDGDFVANSKAFHIGDVASKNPCYDLVFLCVKSYDTEWGVRFVQNYLKPTGIIVSAQNGINDEKIASMVGYSRAIGCVVTLGADLRDAGHVTRTSAVHRPAFTVGELNGMVTDRVKELASILSPVGPVSLTSNLWGARWSKLTVNAMSNPVAGLTGLGSSGIRLNLQTADVSIRIAIESVKVGQELGLEIDDINGMPAKLFANPGKSELEQIKFKLKESTKGLGDGRPSLLQDVLKGRRTEVDFLNGYIRDKGNEINVDTPVNEAIVRLIHEIETGKLEPSIDNIGYLGGKATT